MAMDLSWPTEELVSVAGDIAMQAAFGRLLVLGCDLETMTSNATAITEEIRTSMKPAIVEAMDDAKQALESGMNEVAEMTFKLSMANAGIAAADRWHDGR